MEEIYEKHKLLIWVVFITLMFLPWTGYAMMALVFGGIITMMVTMVAGAIFGNAGAVIVFTVLSLFTLAVAIKARVSGLTGTPL